MTLAPYLWILFTDLDGTLLDKETYEPGPARQALEKCRGAGIPVIFTSSKTKTEMEGYHQRFSVGPDCPFITENGGGVFFPAKGWEKPAGAEHQGRYWKVTLGAGHEAVLCVLKKALKDLGLTARLFSDMSLDEIVHMTGLPPAQAEQAVQREFDEPFWIADADASKLGLLEKKIEEKEMRLTRGGRCFHVHGASDKGTAVRYLQTCYRQARGPVRSAGIGDAANDLPLLRAVEAAYLVKGDDGNHDPDIPRDENILFLNGIGPAGFVQAVDDLLTHRIKSDIQ